ncbi:MAG: signal peptidase I [Clostridia bacterium]|nr:signal peptidase I [Clostridia bacterium]
MNSSEIIAAVTTSVGVITFAVIFTILYHCFAKSSIKEIRTGKRDIELMDEYIHSMQTSVKIRRLIWRVFKGLCFWGVLALLIPVFLFSLVNKAQGNVTMVGGKAVMVVASGSMSQKHPTNDYIIANDLNNQFNTHDLILLEQVDADELKLYDVIAFFDPENNKNVIHRIIGVEGTGDSLSFETRGDSNNTSDEFHPTRKNIIGRYTNFRLQGFGSFILFFQSIGGIMTILALVYCLWMLDRYNGKVQDAEEERLEHLCGSIDLDLEHKTSGMHAEFLEKVYYKGFAYHFNEKGFIGKEVISDDDYRKRSNSSAIRVINSDGKRSEKEVHINSEKGDE